eukprot:1076756-Pyramimonas_sp.AAC.1
MGPRHPWGAAKCESVATLVGCWLGEPTQWSPTQTQTGPRHPWGAANCETDSKATRRSKRDLAIPGGLRGVILSPLSRAAGGARSGAQSRPKRDLAIPGGCEV